MLFVLWEGDLHRTTRDLDLLGSGPIAIAARVAHRLRQRGGVGKRDERSLIRGGGEGQSGHGEKIRQCFRQCLN